MAPRDRLRARLAGSSCAACGALVDDERIRLLARRDELVFLGLACQACGSEGLAIETLPAADDDRVGWTDGPSFGEFGPVDEIRFADARPIVADDVLAMHHFLAAHRGPLGPLRQATSDRSRPLQVPDRGTKSLGGRPG